MSSAISSLHTEPKLVYRGLDRCDLYGAALAPGEQLAGICAVCRWPDPRRRRSGTRKATRSKPPVVASSEHAPDAR